MSNKELERIIENIDTVFRGDAWHGPSVMEIINSLPIDIVDTKQGFSKRTIAQLIFHMVAWRKFIIEKLNDNIEFALKSEEDNWGTDVETSKENWKNLVVDLQQTHKQFIELLETKDDSLLEKRVAGEFYDFYKVLTGLIQHDTYHLGMIWVLWE
ncbi:MAG: putative damage-inducible protein DinB [Spirosomataceae bacterium]|jgi:uncharacterized damage-inducible protein DinB